MEKNPRLMIPVLVKEILREFTTAYPIGNDQYEMVTYRAHAFGIHPFVTRNPECLILN